MKVGPADLAPLVCLLALAGPALAQAPPLVSGIAVRAPAGQDPAGYEPLVSIRTGQQLSMRAVRSSVQRLFDLGRFSNVSVYQRADGPGRVQLTFVLEPQRKITSLTFAGVTQLSAADLRGAARLSVGDDYSEDRVQAALASIRAAYARLGFEAAHVEARALPVPAGMGLSFDVSEGAPTRISEVLLVGDPAGVRARDVFTLRPGDVLDRDALAHDVGKLRARYRADARWRARVESPEVVTDTAGRARVEVEVQAGPRIELRFVGNRALADDELKTILGYEGEELLDHALVQDFGDRLVHAYRAIGYPDARVYARELEGPDHRLALVVFQVLEGLPLRVRQIRFQGNQGIDSADLQATVGQVLGESGPPARAETTTAQLDEGGFSGRSRPSSGASPVPGDQIWNEEVWALVPVALESQYHEAGYLEAQVGTPEVQVDEPTRTAVITVPVQEGRRTTVVSVSFPGAELLHSSGHELEARLVPGDPLSETRLSAETAELKSWYGQQGYLYVTVDARVERPELTPDRALLQFVVKEGPRVKAGQIFVQGNTLTRESVVRDTLLFGEGSRLGTDLVSRSQQRLMRLGIFRTASIRPIDPETPEAVKDVLVDLRERPSRAFEVGGGLSIADGPRAFAEYQQRNLAGSNLEFTGRAKVNYQVFRSEVLKLPLSEGLERFLDLGLRYPHFYGFALDVGARIDLIHEQDIRPSYAVTRFSTPLGFDWRISRVLLAGLVAEVESNDLSTTPNLEPFTGTAIDKARLKFPAGQTVLGSLRPSFSVDLRDDRLETHSGFLSVTQVDYSHDLGGQFPIDFVKVLSTATGYLPLAPRWTLALSVGGGKIFPLRKDSVNFPPKNFFMGGVASLRGFPQDGLVPEDQRKQYRQEIADCRAVLWRGAGDAFCSDAARALQAGQAVPSLGGELYALGRAELRFPIYHELMGATFAEAGNLWLDSRNVDLTLRSSAGFGLRYDTPVGPAALDVGFNLKPDHALNEAAAALHFSIGLF